MRPVDYLPAINDDTVDCPPFAVVMATFVDDSGVIHVERYDGSEDPVLFFNGPTAIPAEADFPGAVGQVNRTYPAIAAYQGSEPGPGETWGAVSGSWFLQRDYQGFTILGGAGGGYVNVVEQVKTARPAGILRARVTVTTLGAAYTRTGNVIEADADGAIGTLDGRTMAVGDQVLLRSSNATAGLYSIEALGDADNPFVLTRSTDMATSAQTVAGLLFAVTEGTTNGDTLWLLTTNNPITLNTTTLAFTQIAPSTGITSINGQTGAAQTLAVGTAGSDFAIVTTTDTNTFNLPDASLTARGAVTTGDQSFNGIKRFDDPVRIDATAGISISYAGVGTDYYSVIGSFSTPAWGTTWAHYDYANSSIVSTTMLTRDATGAGGDAIHLFGDSNAGATQPAYAIGAGGSTFIGQTFTFAGLNVIGGIITGGTYTGDLSIGDPVGSGTANYILYVDGSGNLAQSSDFQWDNTAKKLTLGGGGVLVSSLTSTPTLSVNSTIAGPYLKNI